MKNFIILKRENTCFMKQRVHFVPTDNKEFRAKSICTSRNVAYGIFNQYVSSAKVIGYSIASVFSFDNVMISSVKS